MGAEGPHRLRTESGHDEFVPVEVMSAFVDCRLCKKAGPYRDRAKWRWLIELVNSLESAPFDANIAERDRSFLVGKRFTI